MTDDTKALVERLRGIYRVPIADGLGTAGGDEPNNQHEFVRRFETPPISKEAANAIELLTARAEAAERERDEALAPVAWLYFNEDVGSEISYVHPINSGEVPDATDIRPIRDRAAVECICDAWDCLRSERAEARAALAAVQAENAKLRDVPDYFGTLAERARAAAIKASAKSPQPNYVTLKIAEEAGEVVRAAVHYAEGRMEWSEVEGEIIQLLAMLIRLVTEGDQINGVLPPSATLNGGHADG